MSTLTPHLVLQQADAAIAFYQKAFGATEVTRMLTPDGKILHAELKIGEATLFLCDEFPNMGGLSPLALKGSPVTLHLQVADVDTMFAQALQAGATEMMPVQPMFWGDRYGKLVDPFGHHWSLATHVEDVSPIEMQDRMTALFAQ